MPNREKVVTCAPSTYVNLVGELPKSYGERKRCFGGNEEFQRGSERAETRRGWCCEKNKRD